MMTANLEDMFGYVLEAVLPGVKWSRNGAVLGNMEAAREMFPLFLKMLMIRLRPLSLLHVFDLENVKITPSLDSPCGLAHNLPSGLSCAPVLCLLLDLALELSLHEKNGVIPLDCSC